MTDNLEQINRRFRRITFIALGTALLWVAWTAWRISTVGAEQMLSDPSETVMLIIGGLCIIGILLTALIGWRNIRRR